MNPRARRLGATLCAALVAAQPSFALAQTYRHNVPVRGLVVTPPSTSNPTDPPASAAPAASFSSETVAFGATLIGATQTRTVVLSNTGTAPLTVQVPAAPAVFSLTHDCPAELAAGASCYLSVSWTPTQSGALSSAFTVLTNAAGSPHAVSVTGTATSTLSAALHSDLDNYSVYLSGAFASTLLGASRDMTVYVRASGASGALTTRAELVGADASQFRLVEVRKYAETYIGGLGWTYYDVKACGATLAAGGASSTDCVSDALGDPINRLRHAYYAVRFQPTSEGAKTATLRVYHNGSNASPLELPLSAVAVAQPAAALSSTSLAFGSQDLGASVTPQTVRLTNEGSAPLVLSSAPILGGSAEFSATHNCPVGGVGLAPNAFCEATVTYAPQTQGEVSATLQFASNAPGSPHSVTLSGTGLRAYGALAADTGSSSALGNVELGSTVSTVLRFSNTGNKALSGVAASLAGDAAVTFTQNGCGTQASPGTLAVGASCTMTLRYAPTALGAMAATTVSVASSALNTPSSLALTGSGVLPNTTATLLALNDESVLTQDTNGVALTNVGGTVASVSSLSAVGERSLNFTTPGPSGYLRTNGATTNYIGSRDFTIEAWVRPASATANYTVLSNYPAKAWDATSWTLDISDYNNGKVGFWTAGFGASGPLLSSTTALTANRWAHVAVTRSGNTWRLFVNGVQEASATHTAAVDGATQTAVTIGAGYRGTGATGGYQGQLDGVRIVAGYALYGGSFTPAADVRLDASVNASDAGSVLVGGAVTQTVTLANNGPVSSGTLAAGFTGADAANWSVTGTSCGSTLAAGASCTYTLRFLPVSAGAKSATFAVSGGTAGQRTLALSGTGVASTTLSAFSGYYGFTDGTYATSCQAYLQAGGTWNGVYRIDADGAGALAPLDVYCDQTSDGGGWTMVLGGSNASWAPPSSWNVTTAVGTSNQGPTPAVPFKLSDAAMNAIRTSVASAPSSARYRVISRYDNGNATNVRYVGNVTYAHTACSSGSAVTSYSNLALNSGARTASAYGNVCGMSDYAYSGANYGYFATNNGPGGIATGSGGAGAWGGSGYIYMYVR